jgi:hypothetical protein
VFPELQLFQGRARAKRRERTATGLVSFSTSLRQNNLRYLDQIERKQLLPY